MQIDLDVEFLGGAAPGIDLNDAGHGQQPALHDPVLDGAQIGQAEVRRADHLIAKDLADQAGGLDDRRDVVRQRDVLLQIDRGLRQREVIVDAVIERHADERQTVERGRADDVDAGSGGEPDLDRNGVVALHLLGREAGRLRGDFQNHWRRIRIGLDIEPGKREQTGAEEHQEAQQDERAARQPEDEEALQQG